MDETILIVDDDADIRASMAELLEGHGFRVVSAETGRDALAYIKRGLRPRAIILDLMMPVMDGWGFRAAQLDDPAIRDIPVIMITAAGFSPALIARQFGTVQYVPKPMSSEALVDAVLRACASGRASSTGAAG